MKYLLIKNSYVNWLLKFIKDLSSEFIKPFFTVKDNHITYVMDISQICHRNELPAIVPIQYFSEHVKSGIIYRFP